MSTDYISEFEKIVKKSQLKEIVPFLKGLSENERKKLLPTVKKLDKY